MEKKERDQILKEAFEAPTTSHLPGGEPQTIQPKQEIVPPNPFLSVALPPVEEGTKFLSTLTPPSPFPENELLTSNKFLSFTLPPEQRLNLFEHLPKNLIVLKPAHPTSPKPLSLPRTLSTKTYLEATSVPTLPDTPSHRERLSQAQAPLAIPPLPEKVALAKAPSFLPSPLLPKLPSLDDLQTISYSDAFETELIFSPKEGGGYIFALTLIPRSDLKLFPIRQNYLFLIDRSNSIQRDRLIATKNSVLKAIEEINGRDTFNIFVFDSKIEKLSSIPLFSSQESLAKAENFLNQIELGSFFSQSDPSKPLFLTIPSVVNEDELYTAILITDGESFSKKGASYSLLHDWTRYNDGRVALYAVGMNSDPHLESLEVAAAFNRGKVFTSPTKRGLKRKLLKLMKTVHAPVAKNLSCRAISRIPQGKIEIFPKSPLSPHLYLNEPYVILGQTDSLDDFILFVQGRLNGEWLHIKKTISFLGGKKGGGSLKSEWALQKAYELYEEYLFDNNPNHLAEAKGLLEPYNLRLPSE